MSILFPQADSLEKMVETIRYLDEKPGSASKDVALHLGVTLRQGSYYLSALRYLGFIDNTNHLSADIADILKQKADYTREIYSKILNDPIICQVFSRHYLGLEDDIETYAYRIIQQYFPDYSPSVLKRRAKTLIKWIRTIASAVQEK